MAEPLDERRGRSSARRQGRCTRLGRIGWPAPRPSDERGQALVEFAIVIPILCLLVLGIIKFGEVFSNYSQLIDATRSSARQFAIERGQGDPCGDTVGRLVAAAGSLSSGSISVTITESGDPATYTYSGGSSSGACPTLVAGSAATVAATYPCDLLILGVSYVPGCTLHASATERVE